MMVEVVPQPVRLTPLTILAIALALCAGCSASRAQAPPAALGALDFLIEATTLWEQHQALILLTIGVIAFQSVLISAFLIQYVRRKQAEGSLKKSEDRWRSVVENPIFGISFIELARKEGLPHWMMFGTMVRGWVLAMQGEFEEGIAQIQQGLAAQEAAGAGIARPCFLLLLAEAHAAAGQAEAGLGAIAKGLKKRQSRMSSPNGARERIAGGGDFMASQWEIDTDKTASDLRDLGLDVPTSTARLVTEIRNLGAGPQLEAKAKLDLVLAKGFDDGVRSLVGATRALVDSSDQNTDVMSALQIKLNRLTGALVAFAAIQTIAFVVSLVRSSPPPAPINVSMPPAVVQIVPAPTPAPSMPPPAAKAKKR
jgi:hypothetical protein